MAQLIFSLKKFLGLNLSFFLELLDLFTGPDSFLILMFDFTFWFCRSACSCFTEMKKHPQPRRDLYSFMPTQYVLTAYLSLLRPKSQGIAYPRVVNKVTHVSMNYFLFPLTGSGIHYLFNTTLTVHFSEVGSWTVLLLLSFSQRCFFLIWERKKTESVINCFYFISLCQSQPLHV